MATPPVIFKKEVIAKKDWYNRIKEIMIAAGWQNISSRPSTDFDVMFSMGESGTIPMYLNLKEYDTVATNAISNSVYRNLYYRLNKFYTPGAPGVSGTFERNDSWFSIYMCLNDLSKDALINVYYHCNKNRLILLNEFPPGVSTTAYKGTIQFFGISDRNLGETVISAPIVGATQMQVSGFRATGYAGQPRSNSLSINLIIDTPLGTNIAGKNFMYELAYGVASDGVRGYVDGIYSIDPSLKTSILTGDTIVDQNGVKYRVLEVDAVYDGNTTCSFGASTLYAFRVE